MPAVKLSSSMVGWTPHRVEAGCCCKHMNQQTEIWDDTLTHRCLNKRETFKEIILKEILKVWHFILVIFFFTLMPFPHQLVVEMFLCKQTNKKYQTRNKLSFFFWRSNKKRRGWSDCLCVLQWSSFFEFLIHV